MLIRGREQDNPIRGSSLVSKWVSRPSSSLPRTPPQPQGHRVGPGERRAAVRSRLPQTTWFHLVLSNRIGAPILLCSSLQIMNAVIVYSSLSQSTYIIRNLYLQIITLWTGNHSSVSLKTINLPSSNPLLYLWLCLNSGSVSFEGCVLRRPTGPPCNQPLKDPWHPPFWWHMGWSSLRLITWLHFRCSNGTKSLLTNSAKFFVRF